MKIQENYEKIQKDLSQHPNVKIVAVSKYSQIQEIQTAITANITTFAESKVQDAETKIKHFQNHPNIKWHLIGHLQSNKVNKAVTLFDWIQSVDSEKILKKINTACEKIGKTMPILFQINVANDPAKHGFSINDFEEFIKTTPTSLFPNVEVRGIMVIVPIEEDVAKLRAHFDKASAIYQALKQKINSVDTLSMGMSQDYKVALEAGSTMLRLGSILFK